MQKKYRTKLFTKYGNKFNNIKFYYLYTNSIRQHKMINQNYFNNEHIRQHVCKKTGKKFTISDISNRSLTRKSVSEQRMLQPA